MQNVIVLSTFHSIWSGEQFKTSFTLTLRNSSRKVILQGDFTMEQENGPSAPQQVVNISQVPRKDNKTLKDAYSTRAATILGVFQIIIGVVFFFGEIDIIQSYGPYLPCFSCVLHPQRCRRFGRCVPCCSGSALCVLLCLRRNCHRRSSKWQQVPCGGHQGDEHHLRPLCTCPCDICDLLCCHRFELTQFGPGGPGPRRRVGHANDPPIAEHGDRAHHLGLSRLHASQLSEEAL